MTRVFLRCTLVSLGLVFAATCCTVDGKGGRKDTGVIVAAGEIRQFNATDYKVWVEKLLLGTVDHHAGVLTPGSFKHMGFARLVIGAEIQLEWIEFPAGKELPPKTTYFDSSKLQEVAKQIRYMKFTYTGNEKWTLQVYDRSETDDGYADGKFLKQIVSQKEPSHVVSIGIESNRTVNGESTGPGLNKPRGLPL